MSSPVVERARSREEAKRETREALIRAGAAEFAEHGLAAPSLDAICERAGFTRGAFYVHFRDRGELISAVVERVLGAFLDAILATDDGERDLQQTVRRFASALGADGEGHPLLPTPGRAGGLQFHRIFEASAQSRAVEERFRSLLTDAAERVAETAAAGQAAGTVRRDVPARTLGSLLVAIALGAVTALDLGLPFDPVAARDAVLTLLRVPGAGRA